jgi:hypothetical protein
VRDALLKPIAIDAHQCSIPLREHVPNRGGREIFPARGSDAPGVKPTTASDDLWPRREHLVIEVWRGRGVSYHLPYGPPRSSLGRLGNPFA